MTPEEAIKVKVIIGIQYINCQLIFDIKMDGKFTRKDRFIAGGNMTDPPTSLTYYIIFLYILYRFPSLFLVSTILIHWNVVLETHTQMKNVERRS